MLVISGLALQDLTAKKLSFGVGILWLLLALGAIEVNQKVTQTISQRESKQTLLARNKHVYTKATYPQLKAAFFSPDKAIFLNQISKSTPDYLPRYSDLKGANSYRLYAAIFIHQDRPVTKQVTSQQLVLSWISPQEEIIQLPVVKYQATQLYLNGNHLDKKKYQLSSLGSPSILAQKGKNTLRVSYQLPIWFKGMLITVIGAWLGVFIYLCYRHKNTTLS